MAKAADWAKKIVATLLERGDLELASPATSGVVESVLAFMLEDGAPRASAAAARIVELKGVVELHCGDDDLTKIISASEAATSVKAPPPPARPIVVKSFPKLDDGARLMLVAAQKLADDRKHREITLYHALVAMLESPALLDVARRRGGNPDAARDRAMRELDGLPKGDVAALDTALTHAISAAEKNVPKLANAGDIALAVLHMPRRAERALFQLAFSPPPVARPVPVSDGEEDVEQPPESAAAPQRTPGALVTSADFSTVWRIAHAVALRDGERWPKAERRIGELRVRLVAEAEAELGTVLPDDFWAAACAGILQFSRLGITRTTDHGEPVPAAEVTESVLTVASDAESELDDEYVAIMDLREIGSEYDFVCVEKNVPYPRRNDQRIFLSGASGVDKRASFSKYLLLLLKELHGEVAPSAKATEYRPRLVA